MESTKEIGSGMGMGIGPAFLRCAAAVLRLVNTMAVSLPRKRQWPNWGGMEGWCLMSPE